MKYIFRQLSCIALALLATDQILFAQSSGLSLDQLMGPATQAPSPPPSVAASAPETPIQEQSNANGLSLDQLLGSARAPSTALDASLDLGTIQEGRELARRRDAANQLAALDRQISQNCSCTSGSCFDLRNINISQNSVIEAANEAERTLTDQIISVCESWPGAGSASQDMSMIETRMVMANRIIDALNQIDMAANDVANSLEQQDAEIRYAIAQQQEQSSGFNWGQFAAMSVGVVAGGIGNLDVNTQAEIMSSIIVDSFDGGGSMSNFQSTMNSLNADLASMQQSYGTSGGVGGSGTASAASTGSSGAVINETHSFTCASGTQGNVPIVADSQACASAMRKYAEVMSCNLIDEMESAQRQYESACAAEIYE